MDRPLVSVLIPVYNAGEYLRPSLDSILAQTYSHLEILVIDDGSGDGCMQTIADVRDPRIRILSQENSGRATALNYGLDQIQGEFYMTHDADDLSHADRVERQVEAMQSHPDVAAVFSGHELILNDRILAPRFSPKSVEQCREDIMEFRMPAHDPTGMYRVAMVREFRYEQSLRVGAGLDYILRVGERCPMIVLGCCLYSYRVHVNAITRSDPQRRESMVQRVLQRARVRRGLEAGGNPSAGQTQGRRKAHRDREYGLVPHFMESVLDLRRARRRGDSFKTAAACACLHPLDPYYYKPLSYCFSPFGIIERYRRLKSKHCQAGHKRLG